MRAPSVPVSLAVAGNTFVAPSGWSLAVRGPATILEALESGSFIALVDVAAPQGTRTPRSAGSS